MIELTVHITTELEAIDSFVEIVENVSQTIVVRVRSDGLSDERD